LFKHLLVPLDGSQLAEAALPAAVAVAEKTGARVTLLHVVERNAPRSVHGSTHLRTAEEAEAYLARIVAELFPPPIPAAWHVHRRQIDRLAESLADHAEEFQPDLILMVDHGRSRPGDWLYGRVCQQLIRENDTPLLLLRPGPDGATANRFAEILLPLDGRPEHEAGLPVGADVARLFQASLRLLMVVPTQGLLPGEEAAAGQLLPSTTRQLLDLAAEEGAEYLGRQLQLLEQNGIPAAASLARGEPIDQIEKATRQYASDLVVLSTHCAAGTAAFWSGSMGQKLIARLHISLLLVPIPAARPVE
jgi:nucleotide-binding universal stress UspA family protein